MLLFVLANGKEVMQPLRKLLKTEGVGFDSPIQTIPPSKSHFSASNIVSSPSDAGENPMGVMAVV